MLRSAKGAADGVVQVAPPAGIRIATLVEAYQPALVAAGDDLTLFPGYRLLLSVEWENNKMRRTLGTQAVLRGAC
jgi:hypothetical protein